MMTKEAIKLSDLVIITDDNPRNENPSKIRKRNDEKPKKNR